MDSDNSFYISFVHEACFKMRSYHVLTQLMYKRRHVLTYNDSQKHNFPPVSSRVDQSSGHWTTKVKNT